MFRRISAILLISLAGSVAIAQAPTDEEPTAASETEVKSYGPDGRLESVLYSWPEAGMWKQIFILDDSGGRPVIDHFAAVGSGRGALASCLADLGLTEGVTLAPTRTDWKNVDGGQLRIMENEFARLETFVAEDSVEPLGPGGRLDVRERTQVMGASLTVEGVEFPHRFVTTDNYGGLRAERYGDSRLVAAADFHGPLVHVRRDSMGRIDRALLVARYELRYTYDDTSPYWTRKTVVDLTTGRTLATITARKASEGDHVLRMGPPSDPHPRTTARLTGRLEGPIVAEWDARSAADGTAVVSFNGRPYALLPFEGGPPLARILWLRDLKTPYLEERLDYDETHARIWLQTDRIHGFLQKETIVLKLTRRGEPSPDNCWQDAWRNRPCEIENRP